MFEGQLDPIAGESFERLLERRAQELFYEDWATVVEESNGLDKPAPASALQLRRTHNQRRADALVSLVIDGSSTPADAQRPEPLILFGVDEDTITDVINEVPGDATDDCAVSGNAIDDDAARPVPTESPTEVAFDPARRCETGRGTVIPPRVMLQHFLTDRIRRFFVSPNKDGTTRFFTPLGVLLR